MSTRVVALVDDLMDRSRLRAIAGLVWATRVDAVAGADTIVVDIVRYGPQIGTLRERAPQALIVAFGPHVDEAALTAARASGADRVLPRSRFFADPAAALAPEAGPREPEPPRGPA